MNEDIRDNAQDDENRGDVSERSCAPWSRPMRSARCLTVPVAISTVALVTAIAGSAPLAFAGTQQAEQGTQSAPASKTNCGDAVPEGQDAVESINQKPSSNQGSSDSETTSKNDDAQDLERSAFGFLPRKTALLVPYGVNPASWLNAQDDFFSLDGRAVSADDATKIFGASSPLVMREGVAYPSAATTLSSVLTWGSAAQTVALGTIGGIDSVAQMAGRDSAALAPKEVLDDLRFVTSKNKSESLKTSGSWDKGTLCVWLDAHDADETDGLTLIGAKGSAQQDDSFSANPSGSDPLLTSDGSFADKLDTGEVKHAGIYWVKLARDIDVATAAGGTQRFSNGQVLKIEVREDMLSPSTSSVAFYGQDGSAFDIAGHLTNAGTLYVSSNGLKLKAHVEDPQDSTHAASGISDVRLSFSREDGSSSSVKGVLDASGDVEFSLDAQTLGAGTYQLSKMHIRVTDTAGNVTESDVPALKDATSKVDKLCVVDDYEPRLALALKGLSGESAEYNGVPVTDAAKVLYSNNPDGVHASLSLTDKLFFLLCNNSNWKSKNPLSYTVSGADSVSIDTAVFNPPAASDDTCVASDALSLKDEGTYNLKFGYSGVGLVDKSFGTTLAEASTKLVIDRTAPTLGGLKLEGGYDVDSEFADLSAAGKGRVLIGKGRSFSLDVSDSGAGIASVRVALKRYDSLAAKDDSQTIILNPDVENGKIDIGLDRRGVYLLSDIVIEVTDHAGNVAKKSLADLAAQADASLQAIDRVAVDEQSSEPVVSVVFTPVATLPGSTDVRDRSTQAKVSVAENLHAGEESFFEAYAATKNAVVMSATFTDAAHDAASVDMSSRTFSYNETTRSWESIVPLSRTAEGGQYRLPDGAYSVFASCFGASTSSSFKVDTTAPAVTSADFTTSVTARDKVTIDGKTYVTGTGRSIRLRVQDLLPRKQAVDVTDRDEKATAGLSEAKGALTYTVVRKEDATDENGEKTVLPLSVDEDGYATIDLSDAGAYDLSDINVHTCDKVGNTRDVKLTDVENAGSLRGIDAVLVANPKQEIPSGHGLDVRKDASWKADRLGMSFEGNELYRANSRAFAYAQSVFYRFFSTPRIEASYSANGEQWSQSLSNRDMKRGSQHRWELEIPYPRTDFKLKDGTYSLYMTNVFGLGGKTSSFTVDTTAPQMTEASIDGKTDDDHIARMKEDGSQDLLVGPARTLKVHVQDLLPDSTADVAGNNEADTAGIKNVQVKIARHESMEGNANECDREMLKVDEDGYVRVPLSDRGYYKLSDIVFTVTDNADNELGGKDGYTLADYVRDHSDSQLGKLGIEGIVVADSSVPTAQISVVDAKDTPASDDAYYHRGAVNVTISVKDPWLDVYRHLPGYSDRACVTAQLRKSGSGAWSEAGNAPTLADFKPWDDKGTWTASYTLPKASGSLPEQGDYRLHIEYGGIAGLDDPKFVLTKDLGAFGIDYTAPAISELTLSQVEPAPATGDKTWGWIFARDTEHATLRASDNYSGVADGSEAIVSFADDDTGAAVEARESLAYTSDAAHAAHTEKIQEGTIASYGSAAGSLSFAFGEDAMRMHLPGTFVALKDRAGNVTTSDLGSFTDGHNSNVPAGVSAVTIDKAAPQVSISFDNNDARNGKYYNAARTATVTVDESNFDLMFARDPKRVIATITRDGNGTGTLLAKDFKQATMRDVEGVEHRVWQASYKFEDDADWHIECGFTDGAGRASNTVSEDFVIDTQAPVLTVTFDNNDVANGMYYKAMRAATIRVADRNFSPDLADVNVDSSGATPAQSGWREIEPRLQSEDTVSFTGELHYRLRVAVTDLAGNVAEPYDSGEFVIDMTAPSVAIGNVSDKTAYADRVAPVVEFSDTNFSSDFTTVSLKGARRGDVYDIEFAETGGDTSKRVAYADFPHELEDDDVYTLSGKVVDLAGNESEQELAFSVNRFGSNYYFMGTSGSANGAYLNSPRDIQIAEVNVSGIDTASSHAEIVHDSRTNSLEPGRDYQRDANEESKGWSQTAYTFPAKLFESDGYYRILLTSMDRAGNLSQNSMENKNQGRDGAFDIGFAVDTTAPGADLIGLGSGGVYLDPAKSVSVDSRDNLKLDRAELLVDGKKVASWNAKELSSIPSRRLSADGQPHTYVLEVTDKAGNKSRAVYEDVVVTGDWITFVLNTPRLLFGSVAGAVVLVTLISIMVFFAWRWCVSRRKFRNPFSHQ